MAIKVLFVVQLPCKVSPSQRFRIEIYESTLLKNNIAFEYAPFIAKRFSSKFYKSGFKINKILAIVNGFFNRFTLLFCLKKYDYIFIQREATPIGPPVFEWVVAKILKKKIIFDFDDSIWLAQEEFTNPLKKTLKCYWKIKKICKWSYKVSVGNDFLAAFAGNSSKVILNPTCVDTVNNHNIKANQKATPVTIGWTGSFSTLPFLRLIIPILKELEKEVDFNFLVICNKNPNLDLKKWEYIEWSEANEVAALSQCQIGLMPMQNDEWNLGKCGFKIIQYMSLGIVPVADNWGVNNKIIDDAINGVLIQSLHEWSIKLKLLIQNSQQRIRMGEMAIKKINEHYSLSVNAANFLQLFS